MKTTTNILRYLFYLFIVSPIIFIILGLNIRHRERLPKKGPAILAANHNSHLDTPVLISLFPRSYLSIIRPVAAMDYFFRNQFLKWFSLSMMNILPLSRKNEGKREDLFMNLSEALENEHILILFPEGSRGKPEEVTEFKSGIAHLAKKHPNIPIYPIFLYGLGKSLPKGDHVFVPFTCDIFIGEPLYGSVEEDKHDFMKRLKAKMDELSQEEEHAIWE